MSEKRKVTKAAGVVGLATLLSRVFGFIRDMVIARYFGAISQGIFSLLITIVGLMVIVGKLGMEVTTLKLIAVLKTREKYAEIRDFFVKVIKLSFLSSIILSVILFFAADLIAVNLLNKPFMAFYIRIGSLVLFPVVLLQLNAELLRAFGKIGQYAFLNLFISFFSIIILACIIIFFKNRNGAKLSGIVHIPEQTLFRGKRIGINLLNPGIKYRVAPNRLNVKLARKLCSICR